MTTFRQLIDEAHKQAVGQSGMSAPYLLEVIRALADELDRRVHAMPSEQSSEEPVLTLTGKREVFVDHGDGNFTVNYPDGQVAKIHNPKFTRQQKLAIADEIYDMPKEYNESGIV